MVRASCPNVVKTFLNADTCITSQETCAPLAFSSVSTPLNETLLRQFYTLGEKLVYYVSGLRFDPDEEYVLQSLFMHFVVLYEAFRT